MRVSSVRGFEYQKPLFSVPIKSIAAIRNICGEFAELCTSKQTGAQRLKTDSRAAICPDLRVSENVWIESKSAGSSKCVIVYQHRHQKESEFVLLGNSLFYWVWSHRSRFGDLTSVEEVRQRWAGGLECLYVIGFPSLSRMLQSPTMVLNSHYYSNHRKDSFRGYGWKVYLRDIRANSVPVGVTSPMSVRGVSVPSVPVFLFV